MATPPPASPAPHPGFSVVTAGGLAFAVGGLYFGRDIFVPFALAVLLAFALWPLVQAFRRLKLPRVAAVIAAVMLAFVIIGGIAFVVGTQLVNLAGNLPRYQYNIREKVQSLQDTAPGGGVFGRVMATVEGLSEDIAGEEPKPSPTANAETGPEPNPVPVRVVPPAANPLELLRSVVGPLLGPLATAGIVVVFVVFVLLEREDLRDRFIRLVGAGDLQRSTRALDDAGGRVSRYLLMQLVINTTYGIPIGLGLWAIGVPNAVLWGLLAAVLRFIPYLGPFLAALFPLALAFAVDPGWTMLVWVIALFLSVELVSNNVMEPWLYGSSTGLSSIAIILAAVFWTTLWGPVGLFLSTPLTVCLVVIGRYVPQLEFLGVMLGNDPVLAPEERLYQRLLAGNLEEAVEFAEAYATEHSTLEFYDQVAIPALRLAENDGQRSTSEHSYRGTVSETAICVVRDLDDFVEDRGVPAARADDRPDVLCIAGRNELDRATAEMIGQVLREAGVATRVLPPVVVTQDALGQIDLAGIDVVCISYLAAQPQVYARYVVRKLKRRVPNIKVIVCAWNLPNGQGPAPTVEIPADAVVTALPVAVERIRGWVTREPPSEAVMAAAPDPERVEALHALGLTGARTERFADAARAAAAAFGVPVAFVALAEPDPGEGRPAGEQAPAEGAAAELSSLGTLIGAPEAVVIGDIREDPRFADDTLLSRNGVRFYAGAPLRLNSGVVIGTLCLIDTKARTFTDEDTVRLSGFAERMARRVEKDSEDARPAA